MAHGGELTPVTTAYPLNSRRLTAHVFARIARKLELPTTAPLADLRQIVEGRLAEGGHEPTNVEVLVAQSELGSTITLRDEGGVFLEVPPEEQDSRPDERGSPSEREGREFEEAGEDGEEAAITTHEIGGARTETAGPTARARGREEELIAELESAIRRVEELELEIEQLQEANAAESLRLQEEVSGLEERVKREKEKYSALWRMNCERLAEHDHMISTKDEEITRLKSRVKEDHPCMLRTHLRLTLALVPVMLPVSLVCLRALFRANLPPMSSLRPWTRQCSMALCPSRLHPQLFALRPPNVTSVVRVKRLAQPRKVHAPAEAKPLPSTPSRVSLRMCSSKTGSQHCSVLLNGMGGATAKH